MAKIDCLDLNEVFSIYESVKNGEFEIFETDYVVEILKDYSGEPGIMSVLEDSCNFKFSNLGPKFKIRHNRKSDDTLYIYIEGENNDFKDLKICIKIVNFIPYGHSYGVLKDNTKHLIALTQFKISKINSKIQQKLTRS